MCVWQVVLAVRDAYEAIKDAFKEALAPEKDKVKLLGGLYVMGTERHESRRIDNQLRGRAGRCAARGQQEGGAMSV